MKLLLVRQGTLLVFQCALLTRRTERNLALQNELYDLRSTTKDAYDRAKDLQNRWAVVDREQREVYQVSLPLMLFLPASSNCDASVSRRHSCS